ncbi:MAG: hypothetical protein HYY61_07085 [Deltaproteobacteria bacterium]|nr:hypothetical protein [Deltaproteobacteria bacterium]
MSIKFWMVLGVILLDFGVSSPVFSVQEDSNITLTPFIEARGGYETNVFLNTAPNPEGDSLFYFLNPGIEGDFSPSTHWFLLCELSAEFKRFPNSRFQKANESLVDLFVESLWKISQSLKIGGVYDLSFETQKADSSTTDPTVTNIQSRLTTHYLKGFLKYGWTQASSLKLSLFFMPVRYQNGTSGGRKLDKDVGGGSLEWEYSFRKSQMLKALYRFKHSQYRQLIAPNANGTSSQTNPRLKVDKHELEGTYEHPITSWLSNSISYQFGLSSDEMGSRDIQEHTFSDTASFKFMDHLTLNLDLSFLHQIYDTRLATSSASKTLEESSINGKSTLMYEMSENFQLLFQTEYAQVLSNNADNEFNNEIFSGGIKFTF